MLLGKKPKRNLIILAVIAFIIVFLQKVFYFFTLLKMQGYQSINGLVNPRYFFNDIPYLIFVPISILLVSIIAFYVINFIIYSKNNWFKNIFILLTGFIIFDVIFYQHLVVINLVLYISRLGGGDMHLLDYFNKSFSNLFYIFSSTLSFLKIYWPLLLLLVVSYFAYREKLLIENNNDNKKKKTIPIFLLFVEFIILLIFTYPIIPNFKYTIIPKKFNIESKVGLLDARINSDRPIYYPSVLPEGFVQLKKVEPSEDGNIRLFFEDRTTTSGPLFYFQFFEKIIINNQEYRDIDEFISDNDNKISELEEVSLNDISGYYFVSDREGYSGNFLVFQTEDNIYHFFILSSLSDRHDKKDILINLANSIKKD